MTPDERDAIETHVCAYATMLVLGGKEAAKVPLDILASYIELLLAERDARTPTEYTTVRHLDTLTRGMTARPTQTIVYIDRIPYDVRAVLESSMYAHWDSDDDTRCGPRILRRDAEIFVMVAEYPFYIKAGDTEDRWAWALIDEVIEKAKQDGVDIVAFDW